MKMAVIGDLTYEFVINDLAVGVDLAIDFSFNEKSLVSLFKEIQDFFSMVYRNLDKVVDVSILRGYSEEYLWKIDTQVSAYSTTICRLRDEILKLKTQNVIWDY